MQILRKASEVTPDDLRSLYAYPDGRRYVRANMIASIDGAAGLEGRSGDLAADGDRLIYDVLRTLSDVVIVGAHTAITEGYRQPDGLALAIVSRSLTIPVDYPPLRDPRTVILSCSAAPDHRRSALTRAGATIVTCGTDTVDPAEIGTFCERSGWPRILLEGGPRLLGSFVAADALDELCLTTSPLLLGGAASRLMNIDEEQAHAFQCAHLLTDDDGYLYSRWVRSGAPSTDGLHAESGSPR